MKTPLLALVLALAASVSAFAADDGNPAADPGPASPQLEVQGAAAPAADAPAPAPKPAPKAKPKAAPKAKRAAKPVKKLPLKKPRKPASRYKTTELSEATEEHFRFDRKGNPILPGKSAAKSKAAKPAAGPPGACTNEAPCGAKDPDADAL